ncbi:unnamed protein product [Vitrella brassicaformis CCMP3155]|uniref:Uncharacterized protein n=2 Tax=Vitrella brassicaformis TaxID=1169539 RepID=A0A0G4GX19_VITBC|nr:unnamed protein product [Vitrella brassicaformis CCMP3155]|eukprot:CEM35559.1 unnamed protein product [Vitrella brassicaformis CCMP3155]
MVTLVKTCALLLIAASVALASHSELARPCAAGNIQGCPQEDVAPPDAARMAVQQPTVGEGGETPLQRQLTAPETGDASASAAEVPEKVELRQLTDAEAAAVVEGLRKLDPRQAQHIIRSGFLARTCPLNGGPSCPVAYFSAEAGIRRMPTNQNGVTLQGPEEAFIQYRDWVNDGGQYQIKVPNMSGNENRPVRASPENAAAAGRAIGMAAMKAKGNPFVRTQPAQEQPPAAGAGGVGGSSSSPETRLNPQKKAYLPGEIRGTSRSTRPNTLRRLREERDQ